MSPCPPHTQLVALLEEQLDQEATAVLDRHLADCPTCREILDGLTSDLAVPMYETHHHEGLSTVQRVVHQLAQTTPPRDSHSHQPVRFPLPSSSEAPLGGVGDYDVIEQIGAGATGIVFRAIDRKLGRPVALKVLRGELVHHEPSRSRFFREAQAVAALANQHVVKIYEVGDFPDFPPFLALELVGGLSLQQQIKSTGPLDASSAAVMVRDVAVALAEAHEKGLIHRDVKSSNILVDRSGLAKITDFGLARNLDPGDTLTIDGAIAGTPAYMSPEQIVAPSRVDARSDVYGLGVVLYELLTGVLPFRGTARMTLIQVQHDEPPAVQSLNEQIPRDLEVICLKAMSKDPERRYASATALASDLTAWLEHRPIAARPASPIERAVRWTRRNPQVALYGTSSLVLLLLVAIVATVAAVQQSRANEAIRIANRRATDQATAATTQRDVALSTLRRLVFDVPEALEYVDADTTEVEKLVLDTALEGLEKVAEVGGGSSEIDLQTAAGYHQMAITLYRLNREAAAQDYAQRSQKILQQLQQSTDDTVADWGEQIKLVIKTHWLLADLNPSDLGEQQRQYEAAVTQALRWSEADPRFAEPRLYLGLSQTYLADVLRQENPDDAKPMYARAIEVLTSLSEQFPGDVEYEAALDDARFAAEESDDALNDLVDQSRRLANDVRQLRDANGSGELKPGQQQRFIRLSLQLAEQQHLLGRGKQAERTLRHIEPLLAVEDAPLDQERGGQYVQYLLISGDVELERGGPPAARRKFSDARQLVSKLKPAFPDQGKLAFWDLVAQLGLAEVFSYQGKLEKAAPMYQAVAEQVQTTVVDRERSLDEQRLLVQALLGIAWCADWEQDASLIAMQIDRVQQELDKLVVTFPQEAKVWHFDLAMDLATLREEIDAFQSDAKTN